LALMAKYIVQNCKETIPWWHTFSGGQLFNSDGYNVIVRDGECDGECDGAGAKLIKREVCTPSHPIQHLLTPLQGLGG
jgi:hypothetical protein